MLIAKLEKFKKFEDRLVELEELMSDHNIVNDLNLLKKYSKEHSVCRENVEKYRNYKKILNESL